MSEHERTGAVGTDRSGNERAISGFLPLIAR